MDFSKLEISQNECKLNEYGFFYNRPYAGNIDGLTCMIVCEEYGVAVYIGDELSSIFNVTYSEKTIKLNDYNMVIEISEDGMQMYIPDYNITLTIDDTLLFGGKEIVNGDYTYTYIFNLNGNLYQGWNVEVNDRTKTSYGEILSEIEGKPVKRMFDTFINCEKLVQIPDIPNTVEDMTQTFMGCSSITDISDLIIPDSVVNMSGTFRDTSITDISTLKLPNTLIDMGQMFEGCELLNNVNGFIIPDSVTSLSSTFQGCTSIVDASGLVISSGVVTMKDTFSGCTALEKAPIIPSNVTNMQATFRNCNNLTGSIEINAQIRDLYTSTWNYTYCFYGTSKSIIIKGKDINVLNKLVTTANNNNVIIQN